MAERNAANGYAALKKQTSATAVITPDTYVPYYSQSLATDLHLMEDMPVYGNKFKRFQTLQGTRSHGGSLTVMAEPNTAARWFDMLSTKGTTTGAGPYTHPYGASTTDPNYYTLDISLVSQVVRFWGVQASKINCGWDGEKMHFQLDTSGLGSFYGREIATVATTTITLKTDYDPAPNTGLVVSDLVKLTKVDGSVTLNTTIASVNADGITVTLGASAASFAAGDMIVLRPATPSLSLLTPFIWGKTRFFFAADAATALTNSATASNQTRLEPGTELAIMHEFESNDGSKRSGGFDPASLIRKQYDVSFKAKQFFDNPDEIKKWNAISKQAMIMRAFSGSTNQYELRVTLSDIRDKTNLQPTDSGGVIYHENEFVPNYDQTDAQGFAVSVINNVSTI